MVTRISAQVIREAIFSAHETKKTLTTMAAELGITIQTASKHAKATGLRFKRGVATGTIGAENKERLPLMAALYQNGYTLTQIGAQYGITRERVRQLLTRNCNIRGKNGGAFVRGLKNNEEMRGKRDARYLTVHGCSFEQYRAIRRGPMRAFGTQRHSARHRGIEWKLKAWEWWTIWQESGHWHERGRGHGYVMCRVNDEGPYAVGNVYIASAIENCSFAPHKKKSSLPTGVCFNERCKTNPYSATRMVYGKRRYLGAFRTPEIAHAAYLAAGPQTLRAA